MINVSDTVAENTTFVDGSAFNGKRALISVDVQTDFITGSLPVDDAEQCASRIGRLLGAQHPHGGRNDLHPPVGAYDYAVATQDWHISPGDHFSETPDFKDTWPVHCVAHSEGARLHPRLFAFGGWINTTFHKGMDSGAYSGFEGEENEYGGTLADWLRGFGVTEVDIVGIATDYCVKATALDAVKEGFVTTVPLFLTAAVNASDNGQYGLAEAVAEMRAAGVTVLDGSEESWPDRFHYASTVTS